jgi:small subunit ribosomal protein S11
MATDKKETTSKKETAPKVVAKKTKKAASYFKSGHGRMYVRSTFNTTRVTFTDAKGNVVSWSSAGTCGFKGSKRSTPFAATTIVEEGLRKAKTAGLNSVDVYLKGPGNGKDAAIRVLKTAGLDINLLADITPIPHNGCRPKKPRRV